MRTSTQVVVGVIPAGLLTFLFGVAYLAYAFVPLPVVRFSDTLLMASGVFGTLGLIWAVSGYARNRAVLVSLLLLIGITGLGTLAFRVLRSLSADSHGGGPLSFWYFGWLLLFVWFVAGPVTVAVLQLWCAIRVARSVA